MDITPYAIFESVKIPFIFYIILVFAVLFVLFCMGGYLLWHYHFGKPMAKFFWLRMQGWVNKRTALFEIFTLTNNVMLEEAVRETGDGYRLAEPTVVKVPVKIKWYKKPITIQWYINVFNYLFARTLDTKKPTQYDVKKVKKSQNLIMPKSTYSINGVNTIPLWDLHPQLHTDVIEGINHLIENGITTLKDLSEFISIKENAEQPMFRNYSYRTFYDLYMGVRQKYHIQVTTDDVANFIGKQFDKNFRESIEAKDYNSMQKAKIENKYTLYGWIALIIVVLAVSIRIVYITIWK